MTAATALGIGSLSACSGESAAAGNTDRFDVVASFYPMAFLAERIGGDHVNVTSLTEPGQEPHDLEISARQRARLDESDAVLYLRNLQPSVDDAVSQSGVGTKIDAATLTSLEEHGNEVGGHAAGHDDEHGGEGGGKDPHVWLDPVKYAEVAKGVGAAFEKADPDHAADYRKNTAALVKQYNGYEPLPGLHVIGQNTLGENIADNAGLAIALKAYHVSLKGKPAPVIDGYTGDQRLFLSFGQVWRTKMRDSAVRTQTMSNEHTVAEFRVIGPTRNQDAWYDGFGVKAGEKYYLPPAERVHLW